MKHEWRKHEKGLYLPKAEPTMLEIPSLKYLSIAGVGNPNAEDFAERTAALYSLAYGIRMLPKQGVLVPNYKEYTVYPLEGDWTFVDGTDLTKPMSKANLSYIIMIRQPDFVTSDIFATVLENATKKKPHPFHSKVEFSTAAPLRAVQILHTGSFDTEAASFAVLDDFLKEENLHRVDMAYHREVYLSDPRKTAPESMKTVLRYAVK